MRFFPAKFAFDHGSFPRVHETHEKPMTATDSLEEMLHVTLRRDEAIVLQSFLARELWRPEPGALQNSFGHPAEEYALEGLLHALIPKLIETGGPGGDALHRAALDHLMARFR